ncbi:MAG: hypothetical protein KatS3mg027_1227 [Bacteroidia bacterium]|nr:MAG: hypothetical protein KatS3mg027_1227 [Bacteroidia bacterium]
MLSKCYMFVILLLPASLIGQWSNNSSVNNVICNQMYHQQNAKIVADGVGGAVIVWEDYRNDPTQTNADIYAQRIDKNGYIKWATNGIPVCNNTAHQSNPNIDFVNGKIVVIWNDYRNGNADIYAQMIDTSGNVLWTANGVPVISKSAGQKDGKVIMDASNNVYVAYQDSSAGHWDIYAQKLNSSGVQQWGSNGAVVCNAGNNQINPRLELVSGGGIYVVWQDKRNGVDYDIYAQKIDANGNRQWNVANNGIWVCSTVGTQSNPKIEPFGTGFITAWQDLRNGGDYDIYAQYIDNNGLAQWTSNGKLICNALDNQSAIDMKNNNVDGAYIVWKDKRNTNYYDIYMQKVLYNGNIGWTGNGIVISNANYDQINPNIDVDNSGNALVVWQDSSAGSWDVYAAKVNTSGSVLWTTVVCNASENQTDPKNVSDNSGGTIVVWQDKRNNVTTKWDVYCQKVFSNGSLTSIIDRNRQSIRIKVWPNPATDLVNVQLINVYSRNYKMEILDISGKKIKELNFDSALKTIDLTELEQGCYFIYIYDGNDIIGSSKFVKQ